MYVADLIARYRAIAAKASEAADALTAYQRGETIVCWASTTPYTLQLGKRALREDGGYSGPACADYLPSAANPQMDSTHHYTMPFSPDRAPGIH
jgi:hypothetical protein